MPRQAPRPQTEVPVSVLQWLGMKSSFPLTAIPVNAFSYALNMDYIDPHTVTSRPGSSVFMDDSITGNNSIVGGCIFKRVADASSVMILATANGNLYSLDSILGGTPTLLGTITTGTPLQRVKFAQMKSKLYIADGFKAWVYDPTGPSLTQITNVTLQVGGTANIVSVLAAKSKMCWLTNEDDLTTSISNDPTTYTGGDAWQDTISGGDGMTCVNMVKWLKSVVITKFDPITYKTSLFRWSGESISTYVVDDFFGDVSSPNGFMGDSAVQLGGDIFGLTLDGFTSITALQNFNDAGMIPQSLDIDDIIRRINWDMAYKISGAYDPISRQYMCAVPIDNSPANNIVIIYDAKNQRWGLYDNWPVRTFILNKRTIFYGSEFGKIIQTRSGQNDLGGGFNKVLETGDLHLDSPDTIKLFKELELSLSQAGSYNVMLTPVVDGKDLKAKTINLAITGGTQWDIFQWDVDPWDISPNTTETVLLLLRGKTLRIRLSNSNPDEPFSLRNMTLRVVVTDSGAEK